MSLILIHSKPVLQRKLNLARVKGHADHSKAGRTKRVPGLEKVCPVENVKELATKFYDVPLSKSKILVESKVYASCARSDDDIPSRRTERKRRRIGKRVHVEPLRRSLGSGIRVLSRHYVRSVKCSARVAVISWQHHAEWLAIFKGDDRSSLPAGDQRLEKPIRSFSQRDAVKKVRREAPSDIGDAQAAIGSSVGGIPDSSCIAVAEITPAIAAVLIGPNMSLILITQNLYFSEN